MATFIMTKLSYVRYLTTFLTLLLLADLYFNFFTMSASMSIIFIVVFSYSSFYLKIIEMDYEIETLKKILLVKENNIKKDADISKNKEDKE